jgi:hypothetical protein
MISSQALVALRQLLAPSAQDLRGVVLSSEGGRFTVATSRGAKAYPAAPGIAPLVEQRVVIQNGVIVQVVGANAGVPTYYV